MQHLNIISFVCLLLFLSYTYALLKLPEKTRTRLLHIQLFIVLSYNILIIIRFPYKVPVEFSTLSYFIVPFIALFHIKDLKIWAAYSALLSGAGYYLSMVVFGTKMYSHFPVYSIVTSLFNHGSLLAYAIVVILTININKNDKYILIGGVAFNCLWALIIRPFVLHPGVIFIYEILDATFVTSRTDNMLFLWIPLYFIVCFTFVGISMKIIYMMNKLYKERAISTP